MTGGRTADTHEQNLAKFGLARANPAKSSKEPARSGLAGPISGGRSERRGDDAGDRDWIGIKHELRVQEREKAYALIPC
jgi:hypothetical protein